MSKSKKKHNKKRNRTLKTKTITVSSLDYESITGQKPLTTYFTDFSFAEIANNVQVVKDTYDILFNDALTKGYKHLTELVMVLCYKVWEHYQKNEELYKIYDELYRQTNSYAWSNLKDEELSYFFSITD